MEFVTDSPEETQGWGQKLGSVLRPGDVVALYGELGAGKTCFIRGIARGLKIQEEYITSPSFVLIREYGGDVPFYHIDLYRLSPGKEVEDLGIEEYLEGESVSAIEWAEKAEKLLPPGTIRIRLDFINETKRKITIGGLDEESVDIMTKSEIQMNN
jgi:tRNA threonylcarbamoyladenosine biosynthesis protein TsaE